MEEWFIVRVALRILLALGRLAVRSPSPVKGTSRIIIDYLRLCLGIRL
jgi:hypothetical protein